MSDIDPEENYDGDDGYDYGNDGDDNEEDLQDPEYTDNIVEFGAFRDMGAEGRIGGVMDEDLDINLLDTAYHQKLDAKTVFSLQLKDNLNRLTQPLNLSETDVKTLKLGIDDLHFLRFKNALAYILGYYLSLYDIYDISPSKVNVARRYIEDEKVTLPMVLKYGRYWALRR
jgi:hypothetical protein